MAYAVKYFVDHIADVDGNQKTYRIELLEDGFGGSATEKRAMGEIFTFEFERVDREELFDGLAQKGRLELHLAIQDSSDLAILNNIVAGDEDQYQLRLKEDGAIKWTGFVIPDLIEYSEGDYPFPGTITAKDLTLLESIDYETSTAINYIKYVIGITKGLNASGLGLGLHSYNDWSESQMDSANDYFDQAYIDKYQLQNFSSFSDGVFESISTMEAIKRMVPPGYIIRQWDNVWNILSIDSIALNDGIIRRFEYDSTGTQTGTTASVDLNDSIDRVSKFVMPQSVRKPWRASKRLNIEYNHKSSIQNILFQPEYIVESQTTTEFGIEGITVSDTTNRVVRISGQVEVTTDTDPTTPRNGEADIIVRIGDYELDFGNGSWGLNVGEQHISVGSGSNVLTKQFSITSEDIPVTISEERLIIEMRFGSVSGETVQQVRWYDMSLSVINGDNVDNGSSYNYRLTQPDTHSSEQSLGTIILGEGPFFESNSAIRYFNQSAEFVLLQNWKHVGGSEYPYAEFLLKNGMNLKRNTQNSIRATLRALMNPLNVFGYDGDDYFFLGGTLTGDESVWNGDLVSLNWNTGSDTFESFFKVGESDSGTVIPPSSGTGGTGEYDARYFNESKNLSEGDPAAIRANIGTEIGTDVQAWDTQLQDLADNLTATATELNRLDGSLATVQSNLGLTDGSADLDFNSLNINGNPFVDGSRNITGATLNTGQGANELYPMNQDVRDTASPTWKDVTTDSIAYGLNGLQDYVEKSFNWTGVMPEIFMPIADVSSRTSLIVHFVPRGCNYDNSASFLIQFGWSSSTAKPVIYSLGKGDSKIEENIQWYAKFNSMARYTIGVSLKDGGCDDAGLTLQCHLQGTRFSVNTTDTNIADYSPVSFSRYFYEGMNEKATFGGLVDIKDTLTGVDASFSSTGEFGGLLTAQGGIEIISGNLAVNKTGATEALDVNGNQLLSGTLNVGGVATFQDDIQADNFSSWFSANPNEWQIKQDGTGDFRTLYIDELIAKAFTVDVAQALAGSDILTKSVSKLSRNFTVPAVGNSGTMYVDDLPGLENFRTFESGDWIRLRVVEFENGGPGQVLDVYGTVSSYTDLSDGEQSWTFTTDYAGASGAAAGREVNKGAIVLDYGTSGDYYIERTVLDRSSSSDFSKVPYTRVVQWTGSDPRTGSKSVVYQHGNLSNINDADFSLDGEFGNYTNSGFFKGKIQISDWASDVAGSNLPDAGADVTSAQFSDSLSDIENGSSYARSGLTSAGNVKRIIRGSDIGATGSLANGLNMTGTYMGYYDGSWNVYIKNDGSHVFQNDAGKGISYDASAGNWALDVDDFVMSAGANDYWNSDTGVFSTGGGVLTADRDANEVGLSSWTANSERLYKTFSNIDIELGAFFAQAHGLRVYNNAGVEAQLRADEYGDIISLVYENGNNFINFGNSYGNHFAGFGALIRVSGDDVFKIENGTAKIAGSYFDATHMWSANNGNTWRGSGVYLDWVNERLSLGPNTYIENDVLNAAGATLSGHVDANTGSLGDLTIEGMLSMGTSGVIRMNEIGGASSAQIGPDAMNIYGDYQINVVALPGTVGWTSLDGRIFSDVDDRITMQTPYNDVVGSRYHMGIRLDGYIGSGVPDDAALNGSGTSRTLQAFSTFCEISPGTAENIYHININGKSPQKWDLLIVYNNSNQDINWNSSTTITLRTGGGPMLQKGQSFSIWMYTGSAWVKYMDAGD